MHAKMPDCYGEINWKANEFSLAFLAQKKKEHDWKKVKQDNLSKKRRNSELELFKRYYKN